MTKKLRQLKVSVKVKKSVNILKVDSGKKINLSHLHEYREWMLINER